MKCLFVKSLMWKFNCTKCRQMATCKKITDSTLTIIEILLYITKVKTSFISIIININK